MDRSRQAILDRAFDAGRRNERSNGGCPQCTLAAVFEALGIENEDVFRAATGFADGVGLTGDGHCGALSGGVMAISYLFGRDKKDFGDMMKLLPASVLSKQLRDRFVAEHGACRCADLQKSFFGRFFDLYDPAEMQAAFAAGMLDRCSTVVATTARITTEIILDARQNAGNDPGSPI
ncbi:MAG: C_GCAxxG_C_C family protein [Deltaproteobacteria bacterium]|nr:C_GCAxxG_C_C family protein [Deltaproteobacteria bacterium]